MDITMRLRTSKENNREEYSIKRPFTEASSSSSFDVKSYLHIKNDNDEGSKQAKYPELQHILQ